VDDALGRLRSVRRLDRARIRERAIARFGASRMADAYLEIYRSMVRSPSPLTAVGPGLPTRRAPGPIAIPERRYPDPDAGRAVTPGVG
jgi:hypothetical protein